MCVCIEGAESFNTMMLVKIVTNIEILPKGVRQMFLRLALFEFSVTTRPHIPPKKDACRLPATLTYGFDHQRRIDGHLFLPIEPPPSLPSPHMQSSQPKRAASRNGASAPLRLKTIIVTPHGEVREQLAGPEEFRPERTIVLTHSARHATLELLCK